MHGASSRLRRRRLCVVMVVEVDCFPHVQKQACVRAISSVPGHSQSTRFSLSLLPFAPLLRLRRVHVPRLRSPQLPRLLRKRRLGILLSSRRWLKLSVQLIRFRLGLP